MRSVKCPNGHFYDADKYGTCPHCLIMQNKQSEKVDPFIEDTLALTETDDVLSEQRTVSLDKAIQMAESNEQDEPALPDIAYAPHASSPQYSPPVQPQQPPSPSPYYAPVYQPSPEYQQTPVYTPEVPNINPSYSAPVYQSDQNYYQDATPPAPPVPPAPQPPTPQPEPTTERPSWNELVGRSNQDYINNDNKTVSFGSAALSEPTVGWLIGVNGDYYGDCFELKAGRNFIGRGVDMDVVLDLDRSVSRNKHAIIIYEPHSRVFFAQPGESRELFYINDNVVLKNEPIKAYDILLIGTTKLMFFPLCGPKFSWEDLNKK